MKKEGMRILVLSIVILVLMGILIFTSPQNKLIGMVVETPCTVQSDCPAGQNCDFYFGTGICWTPTNPNYQFCTDSDNGYFPNVKGTVIYKNDAGVISNVTDLCIGNTVMEAVCDLNGYGYNGKTANCVNGCYNGYCKILCTSQGDCPAGYNCDLYFGSGACLLPTNPNYQFCTDSDGGYFPNVKGTVIYKDSLGVLDNVTDLCIGNTVMEAVCDLNGYGYNGKTANCVNNCSNGACIIPSSNCSSTSNCPAGQTCDIYFDTGKCKTPTNPNYQLCTDSDNGYFPNVKGTVSYKNAEGVQSSETDLCIGNKVMEMVCDYNGFAYGGKTTTCVNGCSNGICINIIPPNQTTPTNQTVSTSQTTPVPATPSNITSPIIQNNTLICISGCLYKDKCLPYGYRTGTKYCNIDNSLTEQNSDSICENNFECVSNVCANGNCMTPSFLQKIINFFKNLFGI